MSSLAALTTITWSPASTCGAHVGLCLPRSKVATSLATRPSTAPSASTTCHARAMSPGLGLYVRTGKKRLLLSEATQTIGSEPVTSEEGGGSADRLCKAEPATAAGGGFADRCRKSRSLRRRRSKSNKEELHDGSPDRGAGARDHRRAR